MSNVPSEALAESAVSPHTFEQLLNRQVVHRGLDLVIHVHVPKASGNTVRALFQQNGFTALHFDMTSGSFLKSFPKNALCSDIALRRRDCRTC